MSDTISKTPQKEIHSEQEKRVEMAHKVEQAKQGHLPDNQDLTSGLTKAQEGLTRNDGQLSSTGQAVTSSISNILETAKEIINEKNDGNLLQQAYFHSNQATGKKSFSERIRTLRGTNYGTGNSQQVREEAKQNVTSMATIAKLAFLSPEFRETINDVSQILTQLLKTRGDALNEKHGLSSGEGHSASEHSEHSADRGVHTGAETTHVTHTTPAVTDASTSGVIHAPSSAMSHVPLAVTSVRSLDTPATTTTTTVHSDAGSSAPHHSDDQAHHASGSASSGQGSKKLTYEEKEDKLIDRLVNLAQTLHNNPEYRNSINYIASSANKLKDFATEKKSQGAAVRAADKANEPREEIEHHKQEVRANTKEFVENWIGDDYSLDRLLSQVNYLYESSKTDPELRSLLSDWKKWSTQTVNDSSYVQDKERMRNDLKDLIKRTREASNGKYREQFAVLRREVTYINKSIQRDDSVQRLRDDVTQLGRDLFMDQNGRAVVKPELLGDAQKIIVGVLEAIKYIPLPPIHKNDENIELQLENIVLTATEILPSNVRFIVQADTEKTGVDQSRQNDNSFIIEVSKIRAHLTSINFFLDKKTGFPKITERGLADIDLQGTNGMSLRIEVAPKVQKTGNAVHSIFEPKDVTCSIDKLKIHLRDTKHDFLYKLVGPVLNMAAKKRIEVGVQDAIRDGINKVNQAVSSGATNTSVKANQKIQESDRVQTAGTHPTTTTIGATGVAAGTAGGVAVVPPVTAGTTTHTAL